MTNEPDDFEKMLEESLLAAPIGRRPELGEKVRGAVLAITSEYVLVDLGAKTEGVLDKADLLDADGALTVSVGDEIEAFVTGVEGEIQLSVRVRTGDGSDAVLQAAFEGGLPIEGLVTAVNKGGLEVKVGRKQGFCPLSQIELGYCEDPSIYVGQKLEFRISKLGGRDLLLSRRALLEAEGPSEEELHKARELSKGRLMLRMEDTRAVSGWIGGQQLLLGKVRSVDDAVAEMDAVTIDDVRRVAHDLIVLSKAHLAVVGPYRSDKRFASLLPA